MTWLTVSFKFTVTCGLRTKRPRRPAAIASASSAGVLPAASTAPTSGIDTRPLASA